ncbi:MAG: ATP synthase subunit I [Gammaproteobacteria bacterium]|nr:ATP synthase subunit I [Gammaproteobacteria bacterium]
MDRLVRVQPINHLIKMQVVVLVVTVFIILLWQGNSASIACFFGGGMAIVNTLLQRWHLIRSAKQAKSDAGMNLRKAYRCVAERWIVTIVMFVIGFAVLALSPLPLMTGFIVTQLTLLFGNLNRA